MAPFGAVRVSGGSYGGFERRAHLRYIPLVEAATPGSTPTMASRAGVSDGRVWARRGLQFGAGSARARGTEHDRERGEYRADLVMRAALRCGGFSHGITARGEFSRTGGDRVGGYRGGMAARRGIGTESTAAVRGKWTSAPMVEDLLRDLAAGVPKSRMAAMFTMHWRMRRLRCSSADRGGKPSAARLFERRNVPELAAAAGYGDGSPIRGVRSIPACTGPTERRRSNT